MSPTGREAPAARVDWEARIGRRSDVAAEVVLPRLPAPRGLAAAAGRGQVTLAWEPVPGAAGYLVERAEARDGEFAALEIGEPEVRPVPHPPLTDTTGTPGQTAWYRVAAVAAVKDDGQPRSDPVEATPLGPAAAEPAACALFVDAAAAIGRLHRPWRRMIGSEHLSQLEYGEGPGGRPIGEEFAEALRIAREELGVEAVRAHAILHDGLSVYREIDGRPRHDFSGIDRIYDRVLEIGLHPIVEISFMPRDLARDPSKTVFEYGAIISPPRDWDRWEALVRDLVAHLIERYGRDEVRRWGFEVWNEPDLEVFWSGTRDEYMRLYDVTARAVRSVDAALPVGGPATAAAKWIDEMLAHVQASGAPISFLSTHSYGQAPLDLRPIASRYGRPDLELWWTEWGAHASHFNRVHDSPWSAAYLVRGMASAMGRVEALAYWVVSDHFEELGRPPSLLHGGFGLLSVGNLRKPRYWAMWMLQQLRDQRLAASVEGDGAGDMVNALATRGGDGGLAILAWNATLDVGKADGDPLLDRSLSIRVSGLDHARYRLRRRGVDAVHSNIGLTWRRLADGRDWPDDAGWRTLRQADRLEDLEWPRDVQAAGGELAIEFELPSPSVVLVELSPLA